MKILVIDNFDSFTYNLVQLIGKLNAKVIVKRNNEITLKDISKLSVDKILISPGPGKPEDSKLSLAIVKKFENKIPILGVCLGHQVIALNYGAKVLKAPEPVHGKTNKISHDGKTVYKNIPQNFAAMRYHSLIVEEKSLSTQLEITARNQDGLIMGLRHKEFPIEGIQFHPESILTEHGELMIKNWLKS